MNTQSGVYARPMLVEVGSFTDLTRITCCGYWIDSPWGLWL
jgi:hypothetical protein